MATVAGVDGCRSGWICVLRDVDIRNSERVFFARNFDEVLSHADNPLVIAIDIPIGLPDKATLGGRSCDREARTVLGKRSLAVFAVPARAAVAETDYRRACAVAYANSEPPRQISKQMFHLFSKIREVDGALTLALQDRVYECHPEAAFWAMNDRVSLDEPKKLKNKIHAPGIEHRRTLLMNEGFPEAFLNETPFRRADAGPDDFLDACACAWTAQRIYNGKAIRFPNDPPVDAKGLRMEILA